MPNRDKLNDSFGKSRIDYSGADIVFETKNPFLIFEKWYLDASEAVALEPNAMALATSTKNGKPSVRTVLLKEYDIHGFCFYTNYNSRKGHEISENNQAAIMFYWAPLERQVRVEGVIEKLEETVSDHYFSKRPVDAQVSAISSPQSQRIDRDNLIEKRKELFEKYKDEKPQRPEYWGGYRLVPDYFEFWQGQASRMHDRLAFSHVSEGNWEMFRLAP